VTRDPEGKKSSCYSKLNCKGIPPPWIPYGSLITKSSLKGEFSSLVTMRHGLTGRLRKSPLLGIAGRVASYWCGGKVDVYGHFWFVTSIATLCLTFLLKVSYSIRTTNLR
jgi:hypothetical protein